MSVDFQIAISNLRHQSGPEKARFSDYRISIYIQHIKMGYPESMILIETINIEPAFSEMPTRRQCDG
jgi:hypothetical protein